MRIWPRLELIVSAKKGTAMKANPVAKERPSTTVRLPNEIHQELAVRAALAGMSMGDYVDWMMQQLPVKDADLRRVFDRRREK